MINKSLNKSSKKAFIIGFGRFGKLLFDILKDDFCVEFFDKDKKLKNHEAYRDLQSGVADSKYIFLCMPIRSMQDVIAQISPLLKKGSVVIDVCSVKIKPCEWMLAGLPEGVDIIATHPMFGPDSYDLNLISGEQEKVQESFIDYQTNNNLQIMMHSVRDFSGEYLLLLNYFKAKSFDVLEITPDEHDSTVAYTQGLTHFLGRVMGNINLDKILRNLEIKSNKLLVTKGFNNLMEVREQTCNDSLDLFEDMMKFNPYSEKMLVELNKEFKLLAEGMGELN